MVLLLIGIVAYEIMTPTTLNDKIKETPEQQASDVNKTEESEVSPGTGKDIITYEPPDKDEGFVVDPDAGGNMPTYDPPESKTRHPVSGMFFVENGKVGYMPANPDDFRYGLRVYSDKQLTTNPPIQFVTIYYFKTKEERSAFRPEQHEW